MIVFNIITALVLKRRDKKTVKVSERFGDRVERELESIRCGTPCSDSHKKYLHRKLRRVGNMIAFDRMLEKAYVTDAPSVKAYLSQLDGVFIALCAHYSERDRIEAAYFPYIIKKYRIIANRVFPSITETLLGLLSQPNIYCRENAMQALYTTGDSDIVVKALKLIDKNEMFYHGKLITDGLLSFYGSASELADRIISSFDSFSVEMKVNLLNYMRFSSPNYRKFFYSLLIDEKQNDEIRYCAVRYLGKYPLDEAYEKLCLLAGDGNEDHWEYAAIASSALASYPGEETVSLLKNNLHSRSWYIRANSAESLEKLGIGYKELADVLDGDDRFAAEILRYRLEMRERSENKV